MNTAGKQLVRRARAAAWAARLRRLGPGTVRREGPQVCRVEFRPAGRPVVLQRFHRRGDGRWEPDDLLVCPEGAPSLVAA